MTCFSHSRPWGSSSLPLAVQRKWGFVRQAPGWCCSPRHRGDVGSSPAAPPPEGVGPAPALQCFFPARPPRDRRSDRPCGSVAFPPVVPSRRLRRSGPFRPSSSPRCRNTATRADLVHWSCLCCPVRPSDLGFPPPPVVPTGSESFQTRRAPGRAVSRRPVRSRLLALPRAALTPSAAVPPKCSGDSLGPADAGLPAPRTRCNL